MQAGSLPGWSVQAGWVLFLFVPNVGCGDVRWTATVTGTVSYRGTPLSAGKVSLYGPDGQVASALINEDGSYEATHVPLGAVRVAVSTPLPPPPEIVKAAKEGKRRFGKGNPIEPPPATLAIPPKYSDPAKSGLGLTVTAGRQLFNIELK